MRGNVRFLIGAPWITAGATALYAISHWNKLPQQMAVTFFMGRVTGWQSKATFFPMHLSLLSGLLTLLTVMLLKPATIRIRRGPLNDAAEDRRRAFWIVFLAYEVIGGLLLPLTLVHVVNANPS